MTKILRKSAALLAGCVATVALTVGPASAATSSHGCPRGDVCVYPHASWNGNHPSLKFFTYGPHNLSNQFGTHRVFNNQWSQADVWLCKGYDALGGFTTGWPAVQVFDENLTPVNSIQLTPNRFDALYVGCKGGRTEKHL